MVDILAELHYTEYPFTAAKQYVESLCVSCSKVYHRTCENGREKAEFPRKKLHTYVYNVREDYQLLIFDCKSYEPLHAIMQQELVLLLDENMRYQETEVSKNDIFEAFDFITNR